MKGKIKSKSRHLKVKSPMKVKTSTAKEDIYSSQSWSYGPSIAQPHLLILRNPLLDISRATVLYSTCSLMTYYAVACMVCKVKFIILYKVTQFAFKIRQKFVKLHL